MTFNAFFKNIGKEIITNGQKVVLFRSYKRLWTMMVLLKFWCPEVNHSNDFLVGFYKFDNLSFLFLGYRYLWVLSKIFNQDFLTFGSCLVYLVETFSLLGSVSFTLSRLFCGVSSPLGLVRLVLSRIRPLLEVSPQKCCSLVTTAEE